MFDALDVLGLRARAHAVDTLVRGHEHATADMIRLASSRHMSAAMSTQQRT